MKAWLFLSIAIACEIVATSSLKAADGFTRLGPSLLVAAGYLTSFYFLSLALRTIPVGTANAIWSGVGISLIALAGWLVYGQKPDWPAIAGMVLIMLGVMVLCLFSKASFIEA